MPDRIRAAHPPAHAFADDPGPGPLSRGAGGVPGGLCAMTPLRDATPRAPRVFSQTRETPPDLAENWHVFEDLDRRGGAFDVMNGAGERVAWATMLIVTPGSNAHGERSHQAVYDNARTVASAPAALRGCHAAASLLSKVRTGSAYGMGDIFAVERALRDILRAAGYPVPAGEPLAGDRS